MVVWREILKVESLVVKKEFDLAGPSVAFSAVYWAGMLGHTQVAWSVEWLESCLDVLKVSYPADLMVDWLAID